MMPANTPARLVLAVAWLTLGACGSNVGTVDETPVEAKPVPPVTIMTFNVENLFDNVDDAGKNDLTFLALEDKQNEQHRAVCGEIDVDRWRDQCLNWDWSDEMIDKKLAVIAGVLRQVNDGRGPDIVALQEIENLGILERLREEHLADAAYAPAILIDGDDLRGVDVAFLTRFEVAGAPTLHEVDFGDAEPERVADTRGILQADFLLPDGSLLTGYSVHFPAPFHPTEMREASYRRLNELRAALPSGRPAFAAGDFNTTSVEDNDKSMLERFVRPSWTVAHEAGCDDCRGTSYYARRDDWSFLDMILWSPGTPRGGNTTWRMRADSVQIANRAPGQTRPDGTPWRFEMPGGTGVSDHWPLVMSVEIE
jgi:endonuclease/exonuclease/phosphatase family metal-dependent hydrolase